MRQTIFLLFIALLTISGLAQVKPEKSQGFIDSLMPYPKIVFLIPEKTKGKLISIEFENPQCKTLKWKDGFLNFKIPKNGELCLSNTMDIGLPDEEFYIIDTNGNRKEAKIQEQIFSPEIKIVESNDKEVVIFRFYYGTKKDFALIQNTF